ncbi:MAG: hypothetical protein U1E29_06945 [Coriobacteriia bacterium]|nr:hypothetical protein [Coriobacteriia bacterium]
MDAARRRADLARRRHIGLLIGALLAFVFGGWPGLFVALFVVGVARMVEAWTLAHARPR